MTQYRCRSCRTELEANPLRVSCPECGGQLRSVSLWEETEDAAPTVGNEEASQG